MWRGKIGRSKVAKFAADFFAAEIRAWRDEEPLWKVFWVYGVATSVTIVALYVVAFYDGRMALRRFSCLASPPTQPGSSFRCGEAQTIPTKNFGVRWRAS